jgi:hypothetical protein
MPTKKVPSKASRKTARPERVKVIKVSDLSPKPLRPIPVIGRTSRKNLGAMVTTIGDSDDMPENIDLDKIPRMPNPVPEDIVSLLKLAAEASWLTVPLAPYLLLLIKSWFEGRNKRSLKLKNGKVEMELQGPWSEKKLQREFDRFRRMTKDLNEDDIQVVENGKVIKRKDGPAYKIKEADVQRARTLQAKRTQAKADRQRKAASKK